MRLVAGISHSRPTPLLFLVLPETHADLSPFGHRQLGSLQSEHHFHRHRLRLLSTEGRLVLPRRVTVHFRIHHRNARQIRRVARPGHDAPHTELLLLRGRLPRYVLRVALHGPPLLHVRRETQLRHPRRRCRRTARHLGLPRLPAERRRIRANHRPDRPPMALRPPLRLRPAHPVDGLQPPHGRSGRLLPPHEHFPMCHPVGLLRRASHWP